MALTKQNALDILAMLAEDVPDVPDDRKDEVFAKLDAISDGGPITPPFEA